MSVENIPSEPESVETLLQGERVNWTNILLYVVLAFGRLQPDINQEEKIENARGV